MKFSQRIGKTTIRTILQKESVDDILENKVWNIFYNVFVLEKRTRHLLFFFLKELWVDYFNFLIDELKSEDYVLETCKSKFFNYDWYEFYDFIEFVSNFEKVHNSKYSNEIGFVKKCNVVLEEELSAYRIIDYKVTPISDKVEIESIEDAINNSDKFSNVATHLNSAIDFLSDRENPNYRNSIKESISAVETICRIVTGENTLGKSLKKLEKSGVHINLQLKNAFEKLYLYSNDKETGIRHALLEDSFTPTFDEAKFMLVSCSAFVNYLKSKISSY